MKLVCMSLSKWLLKPWALAGMEKKFQIDYMLEEIWKGFKDQTVSKAYEASL